MIPYQSQVVFKHLRNQTILNLLFLKIERGDHKHIMDHKENEVIRKEKRYSSQIVPLCCSKQHNTRSISNKEV